MLPAMFTMSRYAAALRVCVATASPDLLISSLFIYFRHADFLSSAFFLPPVFCCHADKDDAFAAARRFRRFISC